jgi:hypothetical protein
MPGIIDLESILGTPPSVSIILALANIYFTENL